MVEISNVLRTVREDIGFTYEQLGDIIGVGKGTALKYCKGTQIPRNKDYILQSLKDEGINIDIIIRSTYVFPIEYMGDVKFKSHKKE